MAKAEADQRLEFPRRALTNIRVRTVTVIENGGQMKMSIPKQVAQHHAIEQGDELAVQTEEDAILIRPIEEADPLSDD